MDFVLFLLPAIYLVLMALVILKHGWRAGSPSMIAVLLALAVGTWAIRQSHSSTAGIGYLFLPSAAAVVGMVALGIPLSRHPSSSVLRVCGGLCVVITTGLIAVLAMR